MDKDLNYFLFKMEVLLKNNKKKKPFFRFQNDLAKAIINAPGPYDTKDLKNMRPYINQVLKPGGTAYEKPMSKKLKSQIIKILKQLLSERDPLYLTLEPEFSNAYDILKKNKKEVKKTKNHYDYEEFVQWGLKANKFVALLNEPGEIFWSPNKATKNDIDFLLNRLFEIIFKNFEGSEDGIISILKNKKIHLTCTTDKINSYSYKFYVPNYSVGINFWKSLFHFFYVEKLSNSQLSSQEKIELVSRFFNRINHFSANDKTKEQSFINVYRIAPYLTVIPVVFCQSVDGLSIKGRPKSHEEIFVMSLQKGIIRNVEKLSDVNKAIWKEHVYFDLKNDINNKFGIEELRFAEHEHDIISMINFDDR